MEKFKTFLRISVIITAIIASTYPALFALWAIPKSLEESQPNGGVYAILLSMAFIGYLGWWRLLLFYKSKPLINLVLLAIGLASFIWYYTLEPDLSQKVNWPTTRKEIMEWYIFIYPPIVALYFILSILFRKYIKKY